MAQIVPNLRSGVKKIFTCIHLFTCVSQTVLSMTRYDTCPTVSGRICKSIVGYDMGLNKPAPTM